MKNKKITISEHNCINLHKLGVPINLQIINGIKSDMEAIKHQYQK